MPGQLSHWSTLPFANVLNKIFNHKYTGSHGENVLIFSFRWFCHFDDDNYVNVQVLVNTLRNFNSQEDVYLGKPSLAKEMEVNKSTELLKI